MIKYIKTKYIRSRQDSNLRGETPLDFKSNALTTRPRLLLLNTSMVWISEILPGTMCLLIEGGQANQPLSVAIDARVVYWCISAPPHLVYRCCCGCGRCLFSPPDVVCNLKSTVGVPFHFQWNLPVAKNLTCLAAAQTQNEPKLLRIGHACHFCISHRKRELFTKARHPHQKGKFDWHHSLFFKPL